jgi:calcineurin-like phosphoesterase family protein
MSSTTRYIADLHLSHLNMAIKRGFSSIEEHDELIIERWNRTVSKRDVTYILGDVTMEKKSPYHMLSRLNGVKHVVLGNHDRHQDVQELLKHVHSVSGIIKHKGLWLTHCPVHPFELERVRGNIHGHVHEKIIHQPKYYCVSCENVDYTPVTLKQLGIEIQTTK